MKKFIKSNYGDSLSGRPASDKLIHNGGSIIAAMETLIEAVAGSDNDEVRSNYEYLTDQEFGEFNARCENAVEQLLDLAQSLNDELLHYLNVRYSANGEYSGHIAVGPMGDI